MSNKLTQMAGDILAIEADLPHHFAHVENGQDDGATISVDDFELYTFEQIWGSTATGFGGIGGQAMTTARTYVLIPCVDHQNCVVYFDGRFAYSVPYCSALAEDIRHESVQDVPHRFKYMGKS